MNPEEIETTPETTETTPTETESPTVGTVVQLDLTQYNTLIESQNLLTNRIEFSLLLNITLIALFLFQLMRSKI